MSRPIRVRVVRGERTESIHHVHAAVARGDGELIGFGDADLESFWRSAMKPFQALPMIEDGAAARFGFELEDIAVACGSHGGMPMHVDRVRSMFRRMGLGDEGPGLLACGSHPPYDRAARQELLRAGASFTPLHNNCSGKHAAMLALAHHRGWPLTGYTESGHPVQARIRESLREWLDGDIDRRAWARDGCSVPTPYLSLREMATAYARLMAAARSGAEGPAAVASAMRRRPELTSAPGRVPHEIMVRTEGRLLAKEGAEGVLCASDPESGWALALKVEDGSVRATGPAAIELLTGLELLSEVERRRLAEVGCPALKNWQGMRVGRIEASLEGEGAPA